MCAEADHWWSRAVSLETERAALASRHENEVNRLHARIAHLKAHISNLEQYCKGVGAWGFPKLPPQAES